MFDKFKTSLGKVVEKLSTKELSEKDLDGVMWDLQLVLIQNDVSVKVAELVANDVKQEFIGERVGRFENPRERVNEALRKAIYNILTSGQNIDIFKMVKEKKAEKKPLTIVVVGINGTGKTTTIAKMAYTFQKKGYSCVLAASDTFRAGSIEQIEKHAKNLGIRVIKHDYRSDAAAVAFDAVKHAEARNINVVLIDTAGRIQTNVNLLDEMKKIVRVVNPDLKIFIGDALTGNDAVEQAEKFNEAIQFDASILAKVDADTKGGVALSVAYATKKPIIFVGTGQDYNNLEPFNAKWFTDKILGK
ncbi:MAG: signal recognition particle-docking protein FtsY [Candidatus Jordarchaeum sp.]|uniref:signal recognition particle-docking protein FtsY n=1 Tax=Candidatus Jordarchaeum sp. TaxID=2823881 RepID=UPI004049DE49